MNQEEQQVIYDKLAAVDELTVRIANGKALLLSFPVLIFNSMNPDLRLVDYSGKLKERVLNDLAKMGARAINRDLTREEQDIVGYLVHQLSQDNLCKYAKKLVDITLEEGLEMIKNNEKVFADFRNDLSNEATLYALS